MDFSRYSVQDVAGYNKRVKDVKWNTEGKYFLTASSDHSARVGQLDNSGATKHVHTIPFGGEIEQTFWNPAQDNRFAIIGEDKTIELWDVRGQKHGTAHNGLSTVIIYYDEWPCILLTELIPAGIFYTPFQTYYNSITPCV